MLNRGFDEPIMERPGEWAYEPVDQRYSLHTSSRPPNRHEMSVKLSHEHELYDVGHFICVICLGSKLLLFAVANCEFASDI